MGLMSLFKGGAKTPPGATDASPLPAPVAPVAAPSKRYRVREYPEGTFRPEFSVDGGEVWQGFVDFTSALYRTQAFSTLELAKAYLNDCREQARRETVNRVVYEE